MKCKYITIEREYGSGGTKIARMVSEKTGLPCYGREILEEVSKRYDISVDSIESYEENVTNSFLYSICMMAKASSASNEMLTEEGHVYVAEQAIIRQLAHKGPAIFLGHCACEALKEADGVINVFIRSSDEVKKESVLLMTMVFLKHGQMQYAGVLIKRDQTTMLQIQPKNGTISEIMILCLTVLPLKLMDALRF